MFAALLPLVAQIAMMLLNLYVKNKELKEQDKKIFIQVAETLRRLGAVNVKSRYEAESQIDKIDQAWKDREAKK
jgi:hypothetical protein